MRHGLFGSIAALVALAAGAGLAFGQGLQPLPGPGILDGFVSPAEAVCEPMAAPFGADGAPVSAAQGLFGGGPVPARRIERTWAKGEYLLWSVKDGPSAFPLIVSGTIPGGAVPGLPGAILLFGGRPFDFGRISGARAEVGALLPGSNRVGLEAGMIILPKRTITASATSGPLGIPVLGRPFINELTGLIESLNASSLANPGSVSGAADTMMWSAEVNLFANLYRGEYLSWNVITGFRHFSLAEGIVVTSTRTIGSLGQTFLGNPLPIGTRTAMEDKFQTQNRFYGWNIGGNVEYRWRCFAFDFGAQTAIGDNRRTLTNSSFSQVSAGPVAAPVVTQVPGGLLSAITNLGTRKDNIFAIVPEFRFDVHYQLSQCIRVGVGYTVLYANNVLRPGSQIDPVVNPTLVPFHPQFGEPLGTARPAQLRVSSDYWAQGVNFTVTAMY